MPSSALDSAVAAIKQLVIERNLQAGDALPAVRELAQLIGASPATVHRALAKLSAAGAVETRAGFGNFVARQAESTPRPPHEWSIPEGAFHGAWWHSLSAWQPATDWHLEQKHWEFKGRVPDLALTDPAGNAELRDRIATWINASRSLSCTRTDVIVVSGRQQAYSLTARLLGGVRNGMICEEPGNSAATDIFKALGWDVFPNRVDHSGIVVESLRHQPRIAGVVYVTPSGQIPTGAVLAPSRRKRLAEWASQTNSFIVEDDFGCEFSYETRITPAVASLVPDRTIYIGGFEPLIPEEWKCAFIVVPSGLREAFYHLKMISDRCAPPLVQNFALSLFTENRLESQFRALQRKFANRRDVVVRLLGTTVAARGGFLQSITSCTGERVVFSYADYEPAEIEELIEKLR